MHRAGDPVRPARRPDAGDVAPRLFRQIFKVAHAADVISPAGQDFIDRDGAPQRSQVVRQGSCALVIKIVGHGDLESLEAAEHVQFIEDQFGQAVEPGCVADEPQESNMPEGSENAFVQKLKLNEPFRIIISMRVEKESDPTAEGGNVSPQCVRGAAP